MSNYHHFPKYLKKEDLCSCVGSLRGACFFLSFFLKRFFCGSAQQETINSGALPSLFHHLNLDFANFTHTTPFFRQLEVKQPI